MAIDDIYNKQAEAYEIMVSRQLAACFIERGPGGVGLEHQLSGSFKPRELPSESGAGDG